MNINEERQKNATCVCVYACIRNLFYAFACIFVCIERKSEPAIVADMDVVSACACMSEKD